MSFSDRIFDRKNVNGEPHIDSIVPAAAMAGGEIRISGSGLKPREMHRPVVQFGDVAGSLVVSSNAFLVARVPEGATSGPLVVASEGHISNAQTMKVAVPIAENLHPVTNPALDGEGNIYVTFSGSRGQKVPVAIFKIDTNYAVKPFVPDMMNPTAIAFDRENHMYVTSRHDGVVYRVAQNGNITPYVEGLGIATGLAFDRDQNLYVGDRNGTIFKIGRDRQMFVFATLEPSVSAYHMAFNAHGELFVTGPTTSSFDRIYKIDVNGAVTTFYKGLGRPQGLAFDYSGNLYVAASLGGHRGIVKFTPDAKPSMEVAGQGLVGLAFAPGKAVILATTNAVYHLSWNIAGLSLLGE